ALEIQRVLGIPDARKELDALAVLEQGHEGVGDDDVSVLELLAALRAVDLSQRGAVHRYGPEPGDGLGRHGKAPAVDPDVRGAEERDEQLVKERQADQGGKGARRQYAPGFPGAQRAVKQAQRHGVGADPAEKADEARDDGLAWVEGAPGQDERLSVVG